MGISKKERYHGAAILRIAEAVSKDFPKIYYNVTKGITDSAYTIHLDYSTKSIFKISEKKISIGIYIKTAHARLSPWGFTFQKIHQEEIEMLSDECNEVFIVFACGEDGFTCLDFDELKEVLDENYEETESISISRRLRQNYRVSGTNGKLKKTVTRNFPNKIMDCIKVIID